MNVNMNSVTSTNKRRRSLTRALDTSPEVKSLETRVLESVDTWLVSRVSESPGCVERFVCESFKTGELLSGPSYALMAVSKYALRSKLFHSKLFHSKLFHSKSCVCSAAVSFTLAEQFSDVMELRALQSAGKMGRNQGVIKYFLIHIH